MRGMDEMHITRDIEIARETEMDQEGAHRGPSKRRAHQGRQLPTALHKAGRRKHWDGCRWSSFIRARASSKNGAHTDLPQWQTSLGRRNSSASSPVPVAHRANLQDPGPPRLQGQT